MPRANKGARICETVKAIKQNEELKKLAERREKFQKKAREKKCTDMNVPNVGQP